MGGDRPYLECVWVKAVSALPARNYKGAQLYTHLTQKITEKHDLWANDKNFTGTCSMAPALTSGSFHYGDVDFRPHSGTGPLSVTV